MKRMKYAIALLAFTVTGCSTYSLEELRHATPQGTAFQTALAKRYMEYSSESEKDYDWVNSWHFADKGLVLMYGGNVAPEDLNDWNIPGEQLPDLQRARGELLVALTPEKEAADSDTAARAQFDFDCWVKEQDQNWRQDHIARCRDDFWETLEELKLGSAAPLRERTHPVQKSEKSPEKIHEKKHAALPAKTAEAMEPSPEATIVTPTKAETEAYIVFFQGQDAGLTESGKRVIDEVVNQLAQEQSYEVVLHGYTDTTGTPEDDLKLSESRAQSVKQRLVDGGVRASAIKVFAFGKSDTPVKTADNVAEPANHRVEIFLNDKQ